MGTPENSLDEEILQLLAEIVPRARRRKLKREATLREMGVDSLALMIVVSRFLQAHPLPEGDFQDKLAGVRTVGELMDLGRAAVAGSQNTRG